jgi:hypothetical protein
MALFLLFLACNLASFQVHFGFVLGSFFKALPLFSRDCWLRSHYFSLFVVPGFPVWPERPGFGSRLGAGVRGLRRIIPDLTTLVGYHLSALLSSEKGGNPQRLRANGRAARKE